MSARRPLRRQEDFERTEGGADIPAILMIVAGGVLFMALATHTPDDLPAWTGISTREPSNNPALNFFGPLGCSGWDWPRSIWG